MAADFFQSVGLTSLDNDLYSSSAMVSESVPEGHASQDLVAFAKALSAAGVKFYGGDWCPFCNQQKALFEDGAQFLPFIEVTNPDRTPNSVGINNNITTYPTWEFQGGVSTRQTGVLTLAQLSAASGIAIPETSTPSIAPIANTTVSRGSPLHIPVDGYDPHGGPLTITVSSSNPAAVTAELLTGNSSARFDTNFGPMIFELFDVEGGRAADRFKQLVQQGFYNSNGTTNMTFHRVIESFVIQGGDPTGTGTGGSSLPNFDDQFDLDLQHNRSGVLSYAKSSDDTNDSQFFVTAGPTRNLDFNHSIFGQLVEGDATRKGIARTAVSSNDKPIRDAVINSIALFDDTENGLVRLRAVGAAGATSTITITVTNSDGSQTSTTFVATVANDTSNGSPFLNDIPTVNAVAGQPLQVQLTSQDKEGDTVIYSATKPSNQTVAYTIQANSTTGLVSITPPANFVGSFQFEAAVRQSTNANANDQFDRQLVTVNVTASAPDAPTSIDLDGTSDSGSSNTDNATNAGTLTFTIGGTVSGATVNLRAGTNVIGTIVATSSVTTITTSNLAALGSGTYAITATQTVDSQTSSASPTLNVVFDNVQPIVLASNVIPSSISAGQTLAINLAHPEEGSGLTYGFAAAPAGLTINAQTGVLNWTPTVAQIGSRSFTLLMTDVAGNSRSQDFTIQVNDIALGRVRLQVVDLNNNPLTSLSVGQSFKLQIIADDLRDSKTGVFAAFADINYDSALIELDGATPITRLNNYDVTPSGTTTTVGLVDELGAARNSTNASNLESVVVAEIRFKAKASGTASFSSDVPEGSGRSFLLYDLDTAVPFNRVAFGTASVEVGRNFTPVNDSFNFNEDSINNTLDVLVNDTIVAGTDTTLTIVAVGTGNAGGTISIASDNRSLRYTPAANYNGGESFTYTVRDNTGAEGIATVTVQVQPVNDPPVAVSDTYTFTEGSTDNFLDVLVNDNDGVDSNETLTVSAVGTPSQGGSARVNGGSNAILYTPRAGFTGTETLTYTLRDNNGGTATGSVSITVNPRIPPPTPVSDSFAIQEDAAATDFDVLANDVPSQTGETLTVTGGTGNQGGTVTSSNNNTRLRYAPRANFFGTEIVTYTLVGSLGGSTTGTVTFTVNGVNDAPNASDDLLDILSQPNQPVPVLANDINVDTSETLTITNVSQPASGQGSVTLSNNQITYSAPNTDFTGTVTFTYTIGDGSGLTDTATVTLNVRNFVPRSIGGEVDVIPIVGENFDYQGLSINLAGNSVTGDSINRTLPVGSGGTFLADSLPPGAYTVTVPDLPFINGGSSSTQVVSRPEDDNNNSLRLNVGMIEAKYFDVRDFLGKAIGRGLTAAVANGQSQQWLTTNGAWRDFRSVNVSLNSAGDSLQIQAVNSNSQTLSGNVSVNNNSLVQVKGNEGTSRLIRLLAHPTEISLTAISSMTASGEGEASNLVDAAMSQVASKMTIDSTEIPSAVEGENASSADAVFAGDIDELTRRLRLVG
jgi:cyclophilin family peptidyl-prolyl cis-trans isomerase